MAIIGFSFRKINGVRHDEVSLNQKFNITSEVKLIDVKEHDFEGISDGTKVLRLDFSFMPQFEPKVGEIDVQGSVLLRETVDVANDMLLQFSKTKSLPSDVLANVTNYIFRKCGIKAMMLADDLGLPPPLRLPVASVKNKEGAKQE